MATTLPQALPFHAALQQAENCRQAGLLQEAERLLYAILQTQPNHPEANYNLGMMAMQANQPVAGLSHFKAALEANPNHERYRLGYIDALIQAGQKDVARKSLAQGRQRGLMGAEVEALAARLAGSGKAAKPGAAKSSLAAKRAAMRGGRSPGAQEINQLVALFNAGRHAELENRARMLIEQYPGSGVVWKVLGASLQVQGKDALTTLQKAAELLPEDADLHYNLGVVLQDAGQLDSAVASYAQALAIKPDYAGAHNNLGNALQALGQLDGAVASYRRALETKPGYAEAHNNLGVALKDLRQLDGAVASFRRALEIKPDYADAHNNLGTALQGLGQLDDAVASYRRALEIKPNYVVALHNLAALLNDQGMPLMALDLVGQSLRLGETWDAKRLFVSSVKNVRFSHVDNDVRANLVRALSEPWCQPNELERTAADFVKLDSAIGDAVARAALSWPRTLSAQALFEPAGLAVVAADPLLRTLLGSTPICDLDLERFLTLARRAMLEASGGAEFFDGDGGVSLGFFGALARQCFINEYVYFRAGDEADQARKLRDALVAALAADAPIPAAWPVAVAAYFPLHSLPHAARLLDRSWPGPVVAVLAQQIREPEEERQCRATLPRLTPIEDKVSLLVQDQYEENPYPRWVMTAPVDKPMAIDDSLRSRFPFAPFQPLGNVPAPEILIAGCGTGRHPIETAQRFHGARVLAIDLSLTSLCYAKRKTQELGLTSIEYAQADILTLGSIGRRFDVIESSGVLHHLDDPWAGWRALLSLLRPGGLMRLGFYSEVARRSVVRGRAFIAEQGYGSTAEDIRQCRQDLINLDESAGFRDLLKFSDMFSISECRDLLFHVQEHRMTLTAIEAFLREHGLRFLGFDINSRLLHAYRARFPDDRAATNLSQWQIFENENPDTFRAMYQFWVQKGDAGGKLNIRSPDSKTTE